MTYEETVDKINSISSFGVKPSLERIKNILDNLGNPQNKLSFVHIAGTNGKGTTSSYIASCLNSAGYKTGLYTSPYVEKFTERFRINDDDITENELIKHYEIVQKCTDGLEKYSQFEFITAIALNWFAEQNCDIVVLEVGLGGRFDATNVIDSSIVDVIMSISLDHTAILGDNVSKIAFEKAGIIKNKSDLILYPVQEKEVFDVIEKVCTEQNATLQIPEYKINVLEETLKGSLVEFDNLKLSIPFSGEHQILNAATALKAIEQIKQKCFSITDENIINGFAKTKISARAELIHENPIVILDGGHNEGCSIALKNLIIKQLKGKKITAIIGMMMDKDCDAYLKNLSPLFEKIITIKPNNPRAMNEVELMKKAEQFNSNVDCASNINEALLKTGNFDALVVCGSLFLAGEVRKILKEYQF